MKIASIAIDAATARSSLKGDRVSVFIPSRNNFPPIATLNDDGRWGATAIFAKTTVAASGVTGVAVEIVVDKRSGDAISFSLSQEGLRLTNYKPVPLSKALSDSQIELNLPPVASPRKVRASGQFMTMPPTDFGLINWLENQPGVEAGPVAKREAGQVIITYLVLDGFPIPYPIDVAENFGYGGRRITNQEVLPNN